VFLQKNNTYGYGASHMALPSLLKRPREELDCILKEAGKRDEVSILNTRSLPKALEGGVFEVKLEKQIEAFGVTYETTSVRLSKRKDLEE